MDATNNAFATWNESRARLRALEDLLSAAVGQYGNGQAPYPVQLRAEVYELRRQTEILLDAAIVELRRRSEALSGAQRR